MLQMYMFSALMAEVQSSKRLACHFVVDVRVVCGLSGCWLQVTGYRLSVNLVIRLSDNLVIRFPFSVLKLMNSYNSSWLVARGLQLVFLRA